MIAETTPAWVPPLMSQLSRLETLLSKVATALPKQHIPDDGRLTGTYKALELVPALLDGKVYWSVRGQGGPYAKHGASIWPEVMTPAGFDPDKLDIRQKISLVGWTARYTCNEDGDKPKVVELIPPQKQMAVSPQPVRQQQQPPPPTGGGFPLPDFEQIALRAGTADVFDAAVMRWLDYFPDAETVGKARAHMWGEFDEKRVSGYAAGLEAYATTVEGGETNGANAIATAKAAYKKAVKE
ncbi:MAG: hypothetical protein GY803_23240 [Chloroflexi bacterium]|nr:hypothetical protein [Chloroflexota bacterium]